ncbi:enoyl-CoA hydratase/isomerase family protein [Desulfallas sp. Bu1-1]|uniref:enoyl-CoA hydratase/isomerase family protein n=1 Tax=Desulfallas sp. Bu1-1 TaxID=2787620 RepID=UPI00189D50A9|nr:enoyl-CoA hydratase-related protein [Desulfallas sp. Bu1-1]MBF7084521.1 enoyl-CoA hydratase/isomerase family protein [Desulfallas sp. Bu1-1]
MEEKVKVSVSGSIATITINNPSKRNALDFDILKQLRKIFDKLEADPGLRVVVMRGEGEKAFCAGFSIDRIDTDGAAQNFLEETFSHIRKSRLPVIAMHNGIVVGAGLDLSLNCDIRVAADDVRYGITPAKIGVVYHREGIKRLAEAVGVTVAKELLYTGKLISAKRALEIGLVNLVVARDELESTVEGMAAEICENAPLSVSGTKKILNAILDFDPFTEEQSNYFERLSLEAFRSRDHAEGQKAFLEKRKPVFQGI